MGTRGTGTGRSVRAALLLLIAMLSSPGAAEQPQPPNPVLEVRTYTLKPGRRAQFHQRFEREALPLLRRWNIDVVAYGPSLHDRDSYVLMRAFPSVAERERVEEAFYASPEWRDGPRAAVLADIDAYTTTVIGIDQATLRGLRGARMGRAEAASEEP